MRVDNYWTEKNLAVATLAETDKSPALYRQIGARIAQVREENGLAQTELAQLVGINRHRVFDLESGRLTSRVDALLIHTIAVALGVSVFELLPQTGLILDLASKNKIFIENSKTLTLYNEQDLLFFRSQLARVLYLRRIKKQLTPTELANILGKGQNLARIICKIETGRAVADIFLLLAFASVLEIPLEELFPPIKINRIGALVKSFHLQDVLLLEKILETKFDDFMEAISQRSKDFKIDDPKAIARSLFFTKD